MSWIQASVKVKYRKGDELLTGYSQVFFYHTVDYITPMGFNYPKLKHKNKDIFNLVK